MLKYEMSELKEVSVDELLKIIGWDISDWFEGEVFESGVYKIEVGSRGEIEGVSKVDVVDGVFEVKSVEEMLIPNCLSSSRMQVGLVTLISVMKSPMTSRPTKISPFSINVGAI